jgi:SpoVK/Ycf46/Vps4 family AAA+-type ATPase
MKASDQAVGAAQKILQKIDSTHSNQIGITAEAQILLDSLQNSEDARNVAIDLSNKLLGEKNFSKPSQESQQTSKASITEDTNQVNLEESLAKLNTLIGLQEVKKQVQDLINVHQANNLRHAQGLSKVPVGLHCVFTGSPGTGKTTIARTVAEMYNAIGLLPTSKVVEVDRSRLVAGYVGQTALKVQEVIEEVEEVQPEGASVHDLVQELRSRREQNTQELKPHSAKGRAALPSWDEIVLGTGSLDTDSD